MRLFVYFARLDRFGWSKSRKTSMKGISKMDQNDKACVGGLAGAGAGVAGSVGTVVAVGGGTSAAAITSGLATVGGLVGGGMLAGIGVLAAAPLAIGGICWGIASLFDD